MEKHRRKEYPSDGLLIATIWFLMISFRFISLPLLVGGLCIAHRLGRRNRWAIILRVAFFLSLLSPVDVNVLGVYRGGGVHRSGPRLVRYVVGMPAHTALIDRYGEYYTLGCSGYTFNSPSWMLVLY